MVRLLGENSIGYLWLGEELGGYRQGGYTKHTETEAFARGIAELLWQASRKRICPMCLEVSPGGYHRRFIAEHLCRMGHTLVHI